VNLFKEKLFWYYLWGPLLLLTFVIGMNVTSQVKKCHAYYPEVSTFWCVWGNYGAPAMKAQGKP
jgi:hypothetical protein